MEQVSDLLLDVAVRRDMPIIQGTPLGRHKHGQDGLRLDDLAEIRGVEDASLVLGLVNKAKREGDDDRWTRSPPEESNWRSECSRTETVERTSRPISSWTGPSSGYWTRPPIHPWSSTEGDWRHGRR